MQLGKTQQLKVVRKEDEGYILSDKEHQEILLVDDLEADSLYIDEQVYAFVFKNLDKKIVATLQKPAVELEHFAFLEVKATTSYGAYLDWGLPVDLFVPREEQTERMEEGNWYLVFVFLDEKNNRLLGSSKEKDFLFFDEIDVKEGDEVDLLLYKKSEIGINTIVNNMYKGLIFNSDIHKVVHPGDQIKGFVKKIREDGKIDVVLEPIGYQKSIATNTEIILNAIAENDGFLELTDKSTPEDIKFKLGLSKKAFKKGLGNLYKNKQVEIYKDGIKLMDSST